LKSGKDLARHLNAKELASFRRHVSALKKAGVIPAAIKVKSATPSKIIKTGGVSGRKTVTLQEQVNRFAPVASGDASIVTTKKAKEFRKVAYVTQGDKVMIPHAKGQSVEVRDDGSIEVTNIATKISTIHLPVEYHNLEQYLTDIEANKSEINRMKRSNERFGFQFFGHNSSQSFSNIEALVGFLTGYRSIDEQLRKVHSKEAREMIQNLIIVKGPKPAMYDFIEATRKSKSKKQTGAQRRQGWPEAKKEAYRAKRRIEEQKRRNKNKKGK
jgi:hypothetical protein